MIKKMDILLVVFLFAIAGIMYHFASENAAGDVLYIYKNNKLYDTYSLKKDKTIDINSGKQKNTVAIKKGKAMMKFSTCKNKYCIMHGSINKKGESVICAPNKILLKIVGKDASGYDAVSE